FEEVFENRLKVLVHPDVFGSAASGDDQPVVFLRFHFFEGEMGLEAVGRLFGERLHVGLKVVAHCVQRFFGRRGDHRLIPFFQAAVVRIVDLQCFNGIAGDDQYLFGHVILTPLREIRSCAGWRCVRVHLYYIKSFSGQPSTGGSVRFGNIRYRRYVSTFSFSCFLICSRRSFMRLYSSSICPIFCSRNCRWYSLIIFRRWFSFFVTSPSKPPIDSGMIRWSMRNSTAASIRSYSRSLRLPIFPG